MPRSTRSRQKKRAAPYKKEEPKEDPLFPSRKNNSRIGGDIRHKPDLGRFVKWPRYVRIQRQRKILYQRLKVPPSINQFTNALSKDQARDLFKLLSNYKPESKKARRDRLNKAAQDKAAGKDVAPYKKPNCVQYGLNHVTSLIEKKEAKIVAIASDVNPIELVIWLPALCRRMGVPYCIVKNKSRLGQLVDKKTATCVALTSVNASHSKKLAQLSDTCKAQFNDNTEAARVWGGGVMGRKTTRRLEIRDKRLAEEASKKMKYS
jgi:large subunit ribosomal protein L7Ae